MKDLIEALTILLKYGNPAYPTCCEHDVLHVVGIDPETVSANDREKLGALGFDVDDGHFVSMRFGSA